MGVAAGLYPADGAACRNPVTRGSIASLIVFVTIAAGVIGAIAGGVLVDLFGRTLTMAGMMMTSGCCALLIGLTFHGPLWLFLIIVVIWDA